MNNTRRLLKASDTFMEDILNELGSRLELHIKGGPINAVTSGLSCDATAEVMVSSLNDVISGIKTGLIAPGARIVFEVVVLNSKTEKGKN